MAVLAFADAEKVKEAVMKDTYHEIESLYNNWANELKNKAFEYSLKSNKSAPLSDAQFAALAKSLERQAKVVSNEIDGIVKQSLYTVSNAVVRANTKWLENYGLQMGDGNTYGAFTSVQDFAVKSLITGSVYDSGWSLSKRIWGDNEATMKDIYTLIAKGKAENMSAYDMAKLVEKYVRPSAKLPWNFKAPDGKMIYKKQVDYNAQRLARTLIQHTYQQSFVAVTKDNPFVEDYIWRANGSRVCELCEERDGQHFKKDELPLDHPNGMCVMEPNVDNEKMKEQLADWIKSPEGSYPEIDKFAGEFGYVPKFGLDKNELLAQLGKSTMPLNSWHSSLTQEQIAACQKVMADEHLTWNKFYSKYCYEGQLTAKGKVPLTLNDQKALMTPVQKIVANVKDIFNKTIDELKASAKDYSSRKEADKFYRPLLDKQWANMSDKEKYAIWEYTRNSNPINKSLSGYHDSWKRSDYKGLDKTDLSHENKWRDLSGYTDFEKFAVNGNVEYKGAVQALTTGIEKAVFTEDAYLVRGSEIGGLAGWFENGTTGLNFNEIKNILSSGDEALIKKTFEGQRCTNHAFTSTGISSGSGFDGKVSYKIYAPAGTKGVYAEPQSYYGETASQEFYVAGQSYSYVGGEAEIILQRGTTYECKEIKTTSGGDIEVTMQVVDQASYTTGLEHSFDSGSYTS